MNAGAYDVQKQDDGTYRHRRVALPLIVERDGEHVRGFATSLEWQRGLVPVDAVGKSR